MSWKEFKRVINRLKRGVPIHRSGKWDYSRPTSNIKMKLVPMNGKTRIVIFDDEGVLEMFESDKMHMLRKITTSLYPSAAKHFGRARLFLAYGSLL